MTDQISELMKAEGIDFCTAVEKLAAARGLAVVARDKRDIPRKPDGSPRFPTEQQKFHAYHFRVCAHCLWWTEIGADAGECRIRPPVLPVGHDRAGAFRVYPETYANDWCGEYAALDVIPS